jgi:hypothetical protein
MPTEKPDIPLWGRFEQPFTAGRHYTNPVQDSTLSVDFTAPSGRRVRVSGFWDGDHMWRVRVMPDEVGEWQYTTQAADESDGGLHGQGGRFNCVAPLGDTRFSEHGPIGLSQDKRFLCHRDGTPFLWLADTAWNGPLRATEDEWGAYVRERTRQQFSAVQWVATHWLAAPDGDEQRALAFSGKERIAVNAGFFQRLDQKLETMNRAGLLGAPVLLWSAQWRDPAINESNPGLVLPEDQAILLARYMVARWGAQHVLWILPGDGHYGGENAERWRRIGRAVFGGEAHFPVSLHPCGMRTFCDEFRDEAWLDIIGYQSGHGDDEAAIGWLVEGPPATEWQTPPPRPFINLEPPYENHIAYQSQQRHTDFTVRRALYWSMLVGPTAGVTYGGHGVWGWDDGTQPPVNHPRTGVPLHWRAALTMPGAEQMAHIAQLFGGLRWWTLRPAPELVAEQPGAVEKRRFIAAARSESGDLAVIYVPEDRRIELCLDTLQADLSAFWFDPRNGQFHLATLHSTPDGQGRTVVDTPAEGDWALVFQRSISLPANGDAHPTRG